MIKNEEIKEYLVDFQKRNFPEIVERDLKLTISKKIKSIIGPRRAGKTYFLYQNMLDLIKKEVKKENILYLNFEDPRLIEVNFKEIKDIIKIHWQLYPSSTKGLFYVFIDEPQNIKRWESAVRSLEDEGFNVFITGSSSKLLSKEIATSLRGRTLSYIILPFSFKEFLKMKEFDYQSHFDSREKAILLGLLKEYLDFGGFPEVIVEMDKENKLKTINEYFNLVIYQDIVERFKIKNIQLIKWLIKSLAGSFSKEFSVHKLFSTLKSGGIKLSKNTLYSYLSLLEESMFVFFVPKFTYSIRKKNLSISKAYLADVGFANLVGFSGDKGKRMENVVYLELERRKTPITNIFYWKNLQHEEVDFVVKEGLKVKELIQVCYDISDYDTKKRELKALLKASEELKCKNLLVITEDKEGEEKVKNRKIRYIPLWKWLLK